MVRKITVWCVALLGMLLISSANAMSASVAKPISDSVYYCLKIDTAGTGLGYLRMDPEDLTLSVEDDKGNGALWQIVKVKGTPEPVGEYRLVNVATSDTLRFAPVTAQPDTVAVAKADGVLSSWSDLTFNEGEGNEFKTLYKEGEQTDTYHLTMSREGIVMLSSTDSELVHLNFTVERVTKIPDESRFYRLKADTSGLPDVASIGFLSADTTVRHDSLAVCETLRGDLSLWKLAVDTTVYDTACFTISNKATGSILAFDIPTADTVAYLKQQGKLNQWMIPFFVEDNGIGKFLVRDTAARKDYYLALKDTIVMLVSDTVANKCLKFVLEEDFLMDTTQVYKVKYLNGADSGRYLGANAHGNKILLDMVYAHIPDGQFVVYRENRYALMNRSGAVTTGDSLSVVCDPSGDPLPYQYTNRADTFEIMPIGDMDTKKLDPYLGYMYLNAAELSLTAYVFSFAAREGCEVLSDTLSGRIMGYEHSDSMLILLPKNDTAQFVLDVLPPVSYSAGAPEIAGIPHLERFAYYLRAHDDTTLYISVRANDPIYVDTIPSPRMPFFLKEDTMAEKYYFVMNELSERKLLVDSTKHFNPVLADLADIHSFVITPKERYPVEPDPYDYLTYEDLVNDFSGPGLYELSSSINAGYKYLTKNYYNYASYGKEGESMLRAGSYIPSDFHLWIDTARGSGFNPLKPSFYIVKDVDTLLNDFNITGYFLHVIDSTYSPERDKYVVEIGGHYKYNRLNFVKAKRYSANELLLDSPGTLQARDSVGFADKNEDAINEYRFYLQKIPGSPGEYYIVTELNYGGQRGKRGYLSSIDSSDGMKLYAGPRDGDDSNARSVKIAAADRVSNEPVPPKPPLEEEVSKKITIIGGEGQVDVLNATGEHVTIFNVLGQRIADRVVSSDKETIPVARGVLIVKVGASKTQKVIAK
jgi:hypothetical protein